MGKKDDLIEEFLELFELLKPCFNDYFCSNCKKLGGYGNTCSFCIFRKGIEFQRKTEMEFEGL